MRIRVGVTMCGTALAVLLPVGVIQSAEAVTDHPTPPLSPSTDRTTGGGPPTTGAEVISALLAELPPGVVGTPPGRPSGDTPGGAEADREVVEAAAPGTPPVTETEERPGGVGTGMVPMGSTTPVGTTTAGPGAAGSMEGLDLAGAVEHRVLFPSGGDVPAGGPGAGEVITLSEQLPGGGPAADELAEPVAAAGEGAAPDSSRSSGPDSAGPGPGGGEGAGVASGALQPSPGSGAIIPVLPLGTGLTCLGLGLAILAWHLRRAAAL
ncbi:hypothetical protein GCM10027160_33680 [Streptomyces calidiresistens]|uniref:Tat pathway signal sequence domain protein n=1 Tax=Streptomyces calidiresistens TaxID=1485586 RepID=A0A7W3XXE6_9ACTN|nr:hypothetical protein [Streptomyces calidiresistens]MBB0231020.1 hypothetical protein [Streptomyces calidiresistens]